MQKITESNPVEKNSFGEYRSLEKLEQTQSSFKPILNIPEEAERKIRTLCTLSPQLEWSGVLFYTITGSFEDNNLECTCKDILVMDQGNSGETEFDYSSVDIASYLAQNLELLDCYQGLIHSHHEMQTFFSGTDRSALYQEGTNRNNFLSLIVNNSGTYTARITVKKCVNRKTDAQIREVTYYPFFDMGNVVIDSDVKEKNTEEELIESITWYECDIHKERAVFDNPIIDRFISIQEQKKGRVKSSDFTFPKAPWESNYKPSSKYSDYPYQESLFPDFVPSINRTPAKSNKNNSLDDIIYMLLAGTPLIKKGNLKELYKRYDSICRERFSDSKGSFNTYDFECWLDSWLTYLLFSPFIGYSEGMDYTDTEDKIHSITDTIAKELPESQAKKSLLCFLYNYFN